MENEMDTIKGEFKKAMCFENPVSRFEALIEVARLTDSSDIPIFMKRRINERISENQMAVVGLLDANQIQDDL